MNSHHQAYQFPHHPYRLYDVNRTSWSSSLLHADLGGGGACLLGSLLSEESSLLGDNLHLVLVDEILQWNLSPR
jgi:hypothetical protein